MGAYAALVSLRQILDSILNPAARGRRIPHNRPQLKSLHEKVSFLVDFLESYSSPNAESKDLEIERLETKIRDAAYKANNVIESNISKLQYLDTVTVLVMVMLVTFAAYMAYGVKEVLALSILFFISEMRVFLILVQFLLPLSFQNVIFLMSRILIPLTVHIFVPVLFLSVIGTFTFLTYKEILINASFVKYWLYGTEPENQDLRPAIDDFSSFMNEVIRIKDACGLGQDRESQRAADSTDGLSRWDFRDKGKNVLVGLDGDMEEIYDRLLGYPSELEIVSIVGMGGIGKTTLARRVHDNPLIDSHFDIRAWVTVSQEYSLRGVMLGLLDSAKIRTEEILQNQRDEDDLDQKLGEHLYRNMMSRRYLIVMDDVWDIKIWDFVRIYFPDNNNGSRVLLTTRLAEVASYANSGSPPHQMQFLNDGDSWHLLHEKVFGGEGCPPELKAIGMMIARNCGGLPLAIVVVGGLLYNERRTVQDWTHVSNNLNSILSKDDEQCLEILGLSYKHLPLRLKACFLYMGIIFPEDEEICVTRLFNFWAAEGFLEASKSKSLEEVAEECLQDLIQRSLVLVGKWSGNGKIRTCKIHDLLRDVCRLNGMKKNFISFAYWDGEKVDHDGAMFGLTYENFFPYDSVKYSSGYDPGPRSYFVACSLLHVAANFFPQFFLGFRLLRVLDIVRVSFFEFPVEILKLIHLRYLGLKLNYYLPPSISRLWNLQTIVVRNDISVRFRIPVEIWSMPNLRHLYLWGGSLPDPPSFQLLWNSSVLENLHTLVGILDFRCTKGFLKSVPNLNKLVFYNYGISLDGTSDYDLESLVNLHQLETLKITVEYRLFTSAPKLAFPQKLKKLYLSGCKIPWESMRIVGALPMLELLKVRNHACVGRIWEPVEGEFCHLMFLLLEDIDLVQWIANAAHFPSLRRLILRRLYKLEEIPCDIGEIPTLEWIELVDCLPSAVASANQMQEEQQNMGNEYLKIHIRSEMVDTVR